MLHVQNFVQSFCEFRHGGCMTGYRESWRKRLAEYDGRGALAREVGAQMTNERDRHFSSEINNRHRDLTWGANVVGNSPNERSIRRLPGLVWSAIRLVWASGRREFCLSIGIRLLGGIATAIQLLT